MTEQTATLEVGSWSSKCSHCGGGAMMSETHHTSLLGYISPEERAKGGCGARFVNMSSDDGQDLSRFRTDISQVGFLNINGKIEIIKGA